MEIKFLTAILNKTKDRITNTNIRLALGVDEIRNDIQKKKVWMCDMDKRREDT